MSCQTEGENLWPCWEHFFSCKEGSFSVGQVQCAKDRSGGWRDLRYSHPRPNSMAQAHDPTPPEEASASIIAESLGEKVSLPRSVMKSQESVGEARVRSCWLQSD